MTHIIETQNLSIGFGEIKILEDVNIQIQKGKITTIVGINGSGKSTLLKTLAKIMPKLSGEIILDGKNLSAFTPKEVAKKMAYLAQRHIAPEDITVENLTYYGRFPHKGLFENRSKKDAQIIEHSMNTAHITKFRKRRLCELSGGENQRAWIAMCLAQEPKIMILDEPTTFMDVFHQVDVLELLYELNRKKNITIVMVLHDINQAIQYSDDLILVHNGGIYDQGPPDKVINQDVLYDVFHIKTKCIEEPYFGKTYIPYPERKMIL